MFVCLFHGMFILYALCRHCLVPTTLNNSDYPKLGQWVSYNRRAYHNEQLRAQGHAPGSSARIDAERIAKVRTLASAASSFLRVSQIVSRTCSLALAATFLPVE